MIPQTISGTATKDKYKINWYINTEIKRGSVLIKNIQTKAIKGAKLEETERKTEIIEFGNKVNHLTYKNQYINIHYVSDGKTDMITEFIDWDKIKGGIE